ncbi:actin-like ATPase domain-containing protein [Penicillium maclennaniae]|uniref:actin-like ATPase domain-containing protein n=1 Tax=Penicillium maclennaniae TaxID=1343394 RepID=UPI002540FCE5|nr:actin-like ATPase domain-containing protein [Penicillium maclennaniae]KAJ5662433.1 actin-like ATPase domain-containing protein [Penicillium maclennaniae]
MNRPDPALQGFLQPLKIDNDTLYRLSYRLSHTYRELAAGSSDQFFPTATTRLPTGHEKGRYLAVYLGLYYLRIAFIDLLGEEQMGKPSHVRRTLEKAWPIEDRLRRDQANSLFSWIGDCIAEVIHDDLANSKEDAPSEVAMGISFCFPIKQKFMNEAILMPTGKGFALGSSLNLHQALLDGYECHTRRSDEDPAEVPAKRQKQYCLPKLKINVMTNDTISTFASLAYSIRALPNTRVVMGLIVGAGCNSAVPMKLSDLQESKIQHIREKDPDAVESIVSTEWTLRGATAPLQELSIMTKWDNALEAKSNRPGFQPLEYMVGGRYIGELVRIICYDWFNGMKKVSRSSLPLKLVEEYTLTTDFLSFVVAPSYSDERLAKELDEQLPAPAGSDWKWTPEYAGHFRCVAAAVQDRSAALIAAATVGLLACTREIKLQNTELLNSNTPIAQTLTEPTPERKMPEFGSTKPGWQKGPEELVVAVSGGVITHYPHYKETIQRFIDRLIISAGTQSEGKSIFLREATDGGIIGVGVLAGTVAGSIEGIIGSTLEEERKSDENHRESVIPS